MGENLRNIIISGATGFIGENFVKEMLNNGYTVYAIARTPKKLTGLDGYNNLIVINSDLENLSEKDFPSKSYDCFFHFAWSGVNRKDIDDSVIHHKNFELSKKVLKIAKNLQCRCFMDSGSKAEYGWQEGEQVETNRCMPYNAYGKEKYNFYNWAREYTRENGMYYFHPRFFSVIGVGDHPWSLVSTACRKFALDEDMSFGSCKQLWNFMAVSDAVEATRRIYEVIDKVEIRDNAIFNIAGYDTRVLRSFVEEIYTIVQSKSKLTFQQNVSKKNMDYMNPSIEKMLQLTGWKPQILFSEVVKQIVESKF